jgi:hypothetical protein
MSNMPSAGAGRRDWSSAAKRRTRNMARQAPIVSSCGSETLDPLVQMQEQTKQILDLPVMNLPGC